MVTWAHCVGRGFRELYKCSTFASFLQSLISPPRDRFRNNKRMWVFISILLMTSIYAKMIEEKTETVGRDGKCKLDKNIKRIIDI